MCVGCGYVAVRDGLLCPQCIADGLVARQDGDEVEVVFPEANPVIYEVCSECGRYVDCTDDTHPCPNWPHLRGRHPDYQFAWLKRNRKTSGG